MKLSMWILKNWLSKYNIIANVTNGDMIIEGARLFSIENQMSYFASQIYVGSADGFIGSIDNQVICVCGPDWIRIKGVDKEQIFNDILQAFDYYAKWENVLLKYNKQDFTVQILLDISQGIFINPVFIIDSYSNVVSMSSQYESGSVNDEWDYMLENGRLSLETIGKFKKVPDLINVIDNVNEPLIHYNAIFECKTLSCGITINGKRKGLFVILEKDAFLEEHTIQLANIFLEATKNLMLLQNEIPEFNPGINLIIKLLKGIDVSPEKRTQLLRPINWNIDSEFCIYKINNILSDKVSTHALASRIPELIQSGLAFEYEHSIVFFINCNLCNIGSIEYELSKLLEKSNFVCGSSFIFKGLDDIPIYYKQAKLALELGLQKSGKINHCIDFIWKHMSTMYSKSFDELKLCHPSVEKLVNYDNEHGTKFLDTLYYYLRNERRLTQTAKVMFLHRNTLFYRIERIQEIMETDMDDPDEREYIMLSLQILRINMQK